MKFKKKDLELKENEENNAQVVVINDEGLFLLVSRKYDHTSFSLPGGKVDKGETFEEAAIRETKEETGINIKNLELIFAMHRKGKMGYTYIAEYSGKIDFDKEKEPHVVKWGTSKELLEGTFSQWNKLVLDSLKSLKITFK